MRETEESIRRRQGMVVGAFALLLLLLGGFRSRAEAHQGPPFPIVVEQKAGPYLVSVWADPDVGVGTFYVMLDPPPGGNVPADTTVELAVRPVSGRLPEARHPARRQTTRQQVQYLAEVPFDAQERWRVRVVLRSSQGVGEVAREVEVTPPGLGAFDLLLYLAPFVAVGGLWLRAALRQRRPRRLRHGRCHQGHVEDPTCSRSRRSR